MNLQMLKKLSSRWSAGTMLCILILIELVLFTFTSPQHVAPVVLALAFFVLFGILYAGLLIVGRYTGLRGRLRPVQYNGLLLELAALPVMLLALQSIGQLTPRDSLTLIIIFAATYFYVSRQQA